MTYRNPLAIGQEESEHEILPSQHDEKADFIMRLGRAFLALGSPAHRVEESLSAVASNLGLVGQFFSTPTALFASLGDEKTQKTFMLRASPGEVNLGKLNDINEVLDQLDSQSLDLQQANSKLQDIIDAPSQYGKALTALAFAVTSGVAATFFGGGWADILLGLMVGLVTGTLAAAAQVWPAIARLFEPLAATLCTLIVYLGAFWIGGISATLVTIAGLVVLLPGLGIAVATRELATGQLVAGSARLAGAGVQFLMIAFGVALGSQLGLAIVGPLPEFAAQALPYWTLPFALGLIAMAFVVLFRTHIRDYFWIAAGTGTAFFGGMLGSSILGPQLGAFVGALLVGLLGNLYSITLRRPAATLQIPGLMLLVPGSIGFRSLTALMHDDVQAGVQTAFNATLVAVAIAIGLVFASILLPPKSDL